MENEECSICGVCLNDNYSIELSCGHKYHYECLMSSFIEIKKCSQLKKKYKNRCPYCRKICGELPIVNGLKKVIPLILCQESVANKIGLKHYSLSLYFKIIAKDQLNSYHIFIKKKA